MISVNFTSLFVLLCSSIDQKQNFFTCCRVFIGFFENTSWKSGHFCGVTNKGRRRVASQRSHGGSPWIGPVFSDFYWRRFLVDEFVRAKSTKYEMENVQLVVLQNKRLASRLYFSGQSQSGSMLVEARTKFTHN